MKFLLDESAEFRICAFLEGLGHDVAAIAYDFPSSLADEEVLDIATRSQRILITNDRDFGELIFHHGRPHAGVIYFRLPLDSSAAEKIAWLQRLLDGHADELGKFIVITPRGVRIT
jgi:predicted nuclease of predicted toxin-antitoxin system